VYASEQYSLSTGVAKPERLDLLFQYILTLADASEDFRSRELGPIHLIKYAYLADLAYAQHNGGETFTGTEWTFHHFGPWSAVAFERIEPALEVLGTTSRKVSSKFRDDVIRYKVGDADREELRNRLESPLPWAIISVLGRAVHQHGSDTADLLRHVYLTPPMLAAKPGATLDFTAAVRTVPAAPDSEPVSLRKLSSRERRQREQRIAEARAEIADRLAKGPRGRVVPTPAPRYDDVFFEGTALLDALAGEPVTESEGAVEFDESVWASAQRRDTDLS
jgi:hypothetical protein